MKNFLPFVLMFVAMSSSCQKDLLSLSDSHSEISSDGNGITNFTDLSTLGNSKSEHPFFQALNPHRYYFSIGGSKPCCGQDGGVGSSATITPNFTKATAGNAGNIKVGDYTFRPGSDNMYGDFGGANDPETDQTLLDNFGKKTAFSFKGTPGGLQPFQGTLYFPQLLTISNITDIETSLIISRGQGQIVNYNKDSDNDLPVLVELYWFKDEHMDPANARHRYNVVTNLFLVDDNGSVKLTKDMFKDMPSKAQTVFVTLWRGNAVKDNQGIYFMAATSMGFTVNLTD